MTNPKQSDQRREERVNELIAEYLRLVDRGDRVDAEQFIAPYPDLADSFRQYLQDEALLEQVRSKSSSASSPPGPKDTAESRAAEDTIPPSHVGQSQDVTPKGQRFGRYRIIRQLGQGAMGAVYLAEDPKLERQVALKIPKLRDEEDPESLERFYREARAAATLDHPNICSVYDIGDQDGMPFIAMAYIEGQPLSQLVGTGRMRSERDCAELVRKIALALSEAHRKGVVHRDLKSGNILVDQSDEPVVMDFGLARRIDKPGDERLTKSGTLLGTPAYMAPEQVEGDLERIGPLSDIYSLGVILYELVTGQLPFSGPVAALIAQILRDEPRPPSALRTPVNKRLEAICLKMMSKSPDARFGSAAEVAEALGELLGQTSKHPSASQPATETIRKLEAHRQRTMQLLQACEFSQAIDALERMARLHGPGTDDYATWAKRELARVKALPRELLEKGPAVVETAVELIAAHEYARAAELLRSVPDDYRSTEATKLLAKATKLETETRQLNARVQQAIGTRQYDGLQDDLNRLLEIQPGNLTARELHGKLSTYSPGQPYRFDKSGNLLPAHRTPLLALVGGILRQSLRGYARRQQYGTDAKGRKLPAPAPARGRGIPIVPIAIGLAAVALVLLAIVILFRDDGQTVRVEIDEEIHADPSITLLIDDKQMEIAGLGDTIKLKPGPHGYELRRGDALVHSGKFTVTKGDNPALEISLDRGAAETAIERPERAARQQQTSEPPTAAVAPFDEGQAKRHQRAWAEYLGVSEEITNSVGMKLVLIPPGEFMMGSPAGEARDDERPRRRVRVTQPFYLGVCEVTQGEYEQLMGDNPSGFSRGGPLAEAATGSDTSRHPVKAVSWYDAVDCCLRLSEKEGLGACYELSDAERTHDGSILNATVRVVAGGGYRLPTEAEWEYACRAGTETKWFFGDNASQLGRYAWYEGNSDRRTHPVGLKNPNRWGLYDMYGNVWEWCWDWYGSDYYQTSPDTDPRGPETGEKRVIRGGVWYITPKFARSADRDMWWPEWRPADENRNMGFRVVRGIPTTRTAEPISMPEGHRLPNGWLIGEPENLGPVVNSSGLEKAPMLSADGLTLMFDSDRPGGQGSMDIWMCTRASSIEPFNEPVNLGPNINSSAHDQSPTLSGEGLTLVFESDRPGGEGAGDLWMCKRASSSEPFGEPVNLGPVVNSSAGDGEPALCGDGLMLVFSSGRPGSPGRFGLWMCTRATATEPFGEPENLGPVVNSEFNEHGPALSADGLALLFHSYRPPGIMRENSLIWMCTRMSRNEPFGKPFSLGPTVNSSGLDGEPFLSADGRTLLFRSDRPGGQGQADLWMAPIVRPGDGTTDRPAAEQLDPGATGWAPLFNGRDLTGWVPIRPRGQRQGRQGQSDGDWIVRDGELHCAGEATVGLRTEREFADLLLQLEFRIPAQANSGVLVRCSEGGYPAMEIQLLGRGVSLEGTTGQTGAIFAAVGPATDVQRGTDEWNDMEIRCDGDDIQVHMNGTLIVEANTQHVEKLRNRPRSGFIGFLNIAGNYKGTAKGMAVRNIRIKELP